MSAQAPSLSGHHLQVGLDPLQELHGVVRPTGEAVPLPIPLPSPVAVADSSHPPQLFSSLVSGMKAFCGVCVGWRKGSGFWSHHPVLPLLVQRPAITSSPGCHHPEHGLARMSFMLTKEWDHRWSLFLVTLSLVHKLCSVSICSFYNKK